MSVIGIDFGNDSILIAQAKRGGIDLVLNEGSNRKNACLLSFQGRERFACETAAPIARSNYKNTVRSINVASVLSQVMNSTASGGGTPSPCVEQTTTTIGIRCRNGMPAG